MNYSVFLADVSREVFNNWTILSWAIFITGLAFFFIGRFIGTRFWKRFKLVSEGMNIAYNDRHDQLLAKRDRFASIRRSVESIR